MKLAGTYRATCGSIYRVFWQGNTLWQARTRPGRLEEPAYPTDTLIVRRMIIWKAFVRL